MSATAHMSPALEHDGEVFACTVAMENYLDAKLQIAPETEVTWALRARVADDDTPWSEPIATGTAQAGSSAIVRVPTNYAALRLELSGDATVVVRLTQRMPN